MPRLLLLAALVLPAVAVAQQKPALPAPPPPPAPPVAVAAPAPPPPPAPPAPVPQAAPPAAPAPPPAPEAPPAPPPPPEPPALPADVQAVYAAVEDYLLAFYDAEPERLERSLHPELQKVGFYRGDAGAYHYATMTYEEALDLAARWNRDGRLPADAPRAITVFEVNDQTATARLDAAWGVDHFQLGKYDGTWKIINVIWQSRPPSSGS